MPSVSVIDDFGLSGDQVINFERFRDGTSDEAVGRRDDDSRDYN